MQVASDSDEFEDEGDPAEASAAAALSAITAAHEAKFIAAGAAITARFAEQRRARGIATPVDVISAQLARHGRYAYA